MNKNPLLPLLSLGLLGGCAMPVPDYQPPSPVAPAAWFQAALHKETVRTDAAGDLSRWWRAFDDPLLTELVEQAQQASPDAKSAQARLREARGRSHAAGARLLTDSAAADARRSKGSQETGGGAASREPSPTCHAA